MSTKSTRVAQAAAEKPSTQTSPQFPDLTTLFSSAWSSFRMHLVSIIKLYILQVILYIAAIVLYMGAYFTLVNSHLNVPGPWENDFPRNYIFDLLQNPDAMIPTIILLGLFFLTLYVISLALNIAIILIFSKDTPQESRETLKKAVALTPGFFALTMVGMILMTGSFFFFVIPGITVIVHLMFSGFAYVIDGKSVMGALKRSSQFAKKHFWKILGRVLALYVGLMLLTFTLNRVLHNSPSAIAPFVELMIKIANFFIGYFSIAYFIVLYRQLSDATPENDTHSISWMSVTAVLGFALISVLFGGLIHTVGSEQLQKLLTLPSEFRNSTMELEREYEGTFNMGDEDAERTERIREVIDERFEEGEMKMDEYRMEIETQTK